MLQSLGLGGQAGFREAAEFRAARRQPKIHRHRPTAVTWQAPPAVPVAAAAAPAATAERAVVHRQPRPLRFLPAPAPPLQAPPAAQGGWLATRPAPAATAAR